MAEKLSRREFLGNVVKSAAAAYAASGISAAWAAPEKVRVVRVESDKVWNGDNRDPAVVAEMVEKGLTTFTGDRSAPRAWARILGPYLAKKPDLRIGLKINLLGRPLSYTAPEVTEAVAAGLMAARIPASRIIVWDRYNSHFGPTRYKPGETEHGYPVVVGGKYDASRRMKGEHGSAPIDTIAVEKTDVTINLPLAKDHGGAGVTLALKNIAFGAYQHWQYKPDPNDKNDKAHSNDCDPFIPEAYKHYISVNPIPIHILEATEGIFNGGPNTKNQNHLWRENALYVASDPVALDTVVRKLIMDVRRQKGFPDKTRQCHHIETAKKMGLGTTDLNRIEVVTAKI